MKATIVLPSGAQVQRIVRFDSIGAFVHHAGGKLRVIERNNGHQFFEASHMQEEHRGQ